MWLSLSVRAIGVSESGLHPICRPLYKIQCVILKLRRRLSRTVIFFRVHPTRRFAWSNHWTRAKGDFADALIAIGAHRQVVFFSDV